MAAGVRSLPRLQMAIMTKLLVSVRDVDEAAIAVEAGVDLVDVKEPNRGSLGAVDAAVLSAIVASVAGRVALERGPGRTARIESRLALPEAVGFAKFGLAGCRTRPDWGERWRRAIAALPRSTASVAVVYADWRAAAAPAPRTVVREAARLGCRAVLVDTFDKHGGTLFDHLSSDDLGRFVRRVHKLGLLAVVAGGLRAEAIRDVLAQGPDYVAVRGAACAGDRRARLDAQRVAELVALVRATGRPGGAPLAGAARRR